MLGEEGSGHRVIKLFAAIGLKTHYGDLKLSTHKGMEGDESG